MTAPPRPAVVCRGLLAALEASVGRMHRRQRNVAPDAVGLAVKRELLLRTVRDDPEPEAFEAWLLAECAAGWAPEGSARAVAREVREEVRLAGESEAFARWLAEGAPSEDA